MVSMSKGIDCAKTPGAAFCQQLQFVKDNSERLANDPMLKTLNQAVLRKFCLDTPKAALCEHVHSFYEYRLNLYANLAFLIIFALSFLGFAGVMAFKRTGNTFNIALMLGTTCEVLGYAGRVMSYYNQWKDVGFLIQICCLTIGPAFMAAGIYLCLRRIVAAFGPENSRIPPAYYTRIFIPCDIISLVLQALGGAMASIASKNQESAKTGTNIMLAGLSFQVVILLVFIAAGSDFALRTWRRMRSLGASALSQDEALVRMRATLRFKAFLGALVLSTLLILWRSAFRVAELSDGWQGPIIKNQGMFIGFEGVLIAAAVVVLNVFHPAICMAEVLQLGASGSKGLWFMKKKNTSQEMRPKSEGGESA